jgi:ribosomal protein S18 acetylase RimI-like enzyme
VAGFAETLAALGRTGVRGATEVRTAGALGALVPWATENHWVDAAVVPVGAEAPPDTPVLPHCLWSSRPAAPSRTAVPEVAMPCMVLRLDDLAVPVTAVESPPGAVVGAMNDRAYAQPETVAPLLAAVDAGGLRMHGLRADGTWACVAATLRLDDDVSVQFVATEARFRRRGLASTLLLTVLAQARADGARTATLQASADGLPVYERLGFRTVGTLHALVR